MKESLPSNHDLASPPVDIAQLQGDHFARAESESGKHAAGIAVDTDGIFGPGTERAVIKFQKREGLTVDGVVGPATLAEILG